MAPPDDGASETGGEHRSADRTRDAEAGAWFAESSLRIALVIVGFVILLFGLGQAVGLDLLGLAAEALSTRMGRWLLVAIFGLLLIAVAVRGFGWYRE